MQAKLSEGVVRYMWVFIGCLLLATGSLCAVGQETRASLGGRVTDSSGAIVQKATVIVTADETRVVQRTVTNNVGLWRIHYLLPGSYHFQVTAKGFKTETHQHVELQINDVITMDTQLQVGSQTQSVVVSSLTPLIDTTAAVSGTVITEAELNELPSNSNGPTSAMNLAVGVTMNDIGTGSTLLSSNGGLSQSGVNGIGSPSGSTNTAPNAPALGYASTFTIDGGNDVNNTGSIGFEPPLDATSEMKVVTNAYDASIGRAAGSIAVLQTKSGTQSYHGDLYFDAENNIFGANTYSNDANDIPKQSGYTYNYGGSFGGPLSIPKLFNGVRHGTFFYASYTGIRSGGAGAAQFMSVPSAAERTGDFSQSYTVNSGVRYPISIYDPNTVVPTSGGNFTRTQFSGNVIPSNRISPIASRIFQDLPLPNSPAQTDVSNDDNNYLNKDATSSNPVESYMVRADRAWNNDNHSFINLRQNHWLSTNTYFGAPGTYLNAGKTARINKGLTIDHTVVFGPSLLLDLNASIIKWNQIAVSANAGLDPTGWGYSSTYASQMQAPGLPLIENVVPGQYLGTKSNNNPQLSDVDQDYKASLTQTLGRHTLQYGAEYMIEQTTTRSLGASSGIMTFGTNWTKATPVGANPTGAGDILADFALGLPNGASYTQAATGFWSQHYQAYYFQDDWRVTPKLTVNMGLRWDYERPVTERFNRFTSRYDPNFQIPGVTAASQANYASLLGESSEGNTGLALLQSARPNASSFVPSGGFLYAGVDGTSRYVENPIKKYFQPRLGFAYQIFPHTVIRGGLGRFVNTDFVNAANFQTGYSQVTNATVTTDNYESAPTISMANPYPDGMQPAIGNSEREATNFGTFGSYFDPNIGRVYADEASVSVQQQIKSFLFEIGWVTTKVHGLYMGWETNNPTSAEWHAAFDPQFTSTGAPVLTLPGNTQVSNPFYHVTGIYPSAGYYKSSQIGAYNLLRPNPILGSLIAYKGTGQSNYNGLNAKIEKRFNNGFGLIQNFTWGKNETANSFIGPQVAQPKIYHQLSSFDQRFHYMLVPMYELPIGRGRRFGSHVDRFVDELIGGWELTGQYEYLSGTPLVLPTNTNAGTTPAVQSGLFEGGDPTLDKDKTGTHWFNTSMFAPVPTSSTTRAQLAQYPGWTGVTAMPGYNWVPTPNAPGYGGINNGIFNDYTTRVTYNQQIWGSIRNPAENMLNIGVRKTFAITKESKSNLELGLDAFNALNHPQFGNIDVKPNDAGFGMISGSASRSKWIAVNGPRAIQLKARFTF